MSKNEKGGSWEPLRYYEKRTQELEHLKSQAKSQTLKTLITRAIDQSEAALQKLMSVKDETVTYIKSETTKYHQSNAKVEEQITLLKNEIIKIDSIENINNEAKEEALKYLNKVLNIGMKTKNNKKDVFMLQVDVMPRTALEFQNLLLELIFKPNSSSFHYDTIVNALKFLAGLFIPGLDNLATATDSPISVSLRKKQYIESGDKILIYIEQYLDILEKWNGLADEYLKTLRN